MANPLDELLAEPETSEDVQPQDVIPAGETPTQTQSRENAANRIRASDLASRGIPSFRDAYGHVAEVTDDTGAPLLHFDKAHGIAYDSAGQPKAVSYESDTGPPTVKDPFAGIPVTTEEDTGEQYQKVKGLPWNYVGTDPAIAAQRLQEDKDKSLAKESTLVGQKLSLDHADLVAGTKERETLKKSLLNTVPELAVDPKYHGADIDTIKKAIDSHFDSEYAAPEANQKAGWFDDKLSPDAQAIRGQIDARKAAAHATAEKVFDMGDQLTELASSVQAGRDERRASVETLLAHQRGEQGPLDPEYQQAVFEQQQRQAFEQKKEELNKSFLNPTNSAPIRGAATGQDSNTPQPVRAEIGDHVAAQLGIKPSIWQKATNFIGEVVGAGATTVAKGLTGFSQAGEAIWHGLFGDWDLPTYDKSQPSSIRSIAYALQKVPGIITNPALKDTTEAKAGRLVGEYGSLIGEAIVNPAIAVTNMVGLGYEGQHDAAVQYFDAQAKQNPDKPRDAAQEQATADRAGVLGAAINGVLAMVPIGKAGAAIKEFFGKAETDVVAKALNQAYERGGAAGVAQTLNELKGVMAKTASPAFAEVASKGLQGVIDEISKSPADRLAAVGGRAITDAGWFSAAQVGQNLVSKTYNPDTGLFENVPSAAATGAVLGTIGGTFEQVARANKARQAEIDIKSALAKQVGVPGPEPPPEGATGTELVPTPKGPAPKGGETVPPATPSVEKVVTGKEVTPTPTAKGGGEVGTKEEVKGNAAEEEKGKGNAVLTPNPEPRSMSRPAIERELKGMGYTVEWDGTLSKGGEEAQPHEARAIQLNEELAKRPIEEPVDEAAHEAATSNQNNLPEPTQAQKEAGNYKKGHITVGGLDVSIENPAGSKRKPEYAPLQSHYGYIKGTVGADKDHVDIFVKQGTPTDWNGPVFVVNQRNSAGKFDEHKAVIGVNNKSEAAKEYLSNYQPGWNGLQNVVEFPNPQSFKQWAESGVKGPAVEPKTAKGESITKYGGGLTPEQDNLKKMVTGVLNQHKEVLTTLGHTSAAIGDTGENNTSGIATVGGKITVDFGKLHESTKALTPRARTKFIQRGVEEEVLHVAGQKWEGEKPENRQKITTWGAEKDELDKHLSESYTGWEKLNDRQKGHEKLRAVLQKRWTGKLTEAAYRVVRDFLKYLRGIWGKLTPDQRNIVSEVEARMKGEPEWKETEITPTKAGLVGKESGLPERRTHRQQLEKRITDLGDKVPAVSRQLLRTLLASGPRKEPNVSALQQAERKIAQLEKTNATTTGKEQKGEGEELPRVPPRGNVPAHEAEIRQGGREQTTGRGGPVERPTTPEPERKAEEAQPSTGQPSEKPAVTSTLDAETQQQMRDAFEGLAAAPPVQAIKRSAIKLADGTIFEDPTPDTELVKMGHSGAKNAAIEAGKPVKDVIDSIEGFTTTKGNFLTKDQAWKAARIGSSLDLEEAQRFTLGAGTPLAAIPQKAIPAEKLGAFVNLAQTLIKKGIDTPEKLARELDAVIPEKGRGYAQAVWDMLGTVNPKLRGTYNWQTVFAAQIGKKEEAPESRYKDPRPFAEQALSLTIKQDLLAGQAVPRTELTSRAQDAGLETKAADEAAEVGVVQAAREIIKNARAPQDAIFDRLVKLYDDQPNLSAKTSTSKIAQAYSTPIPLAYAASRLADITGGKSIYEPTAGNGALLIEADPNTQRVLANEINDSRRKALEAQGFKVWGADATERIASDMNRGEKFDRITENPPFGTIIDENAERKTWQMWDSETRQIDHAIVAKSLEALKDDGRAVLLIGGKNIIDPEQRAQAYAQGGRFYKELYSRYRVIDHFTIDGDLYKKQGAAWPVDVIVIAGRGRSPIQLPSAVAPRILSTWEQLKDELTRTDADRIKAGAFDEGKAGAEASGVFADIRTVAGSPERAGGEAGVQPAATGHGPGGLPARGSVATGEQPESVSGTETGAESATGRAGGISLHEPADEPVQRGTVDLESFRTPYRPVSKAESFNIFIPTNMDSAVHDALKKLRAEVGDLDKYVVDKLGYTPPKNAFSAEQIDALAPGIYAAEKSSAYVLGDQGGVGKGRVAAGMMVYALNRGLTPIFITKDVKLYAAMIGDLADIGRADLVPIFTDQNIIFEDETGKVWKTGKTMPLMDQIAATGQLPKDTHLFFTTYSQIQDDVPKGFKHNKAESAARKAQKQPPPDGSRMNALNRLAPNALFIMDESHLASGDSIRAWRIAPLLEKAPAAYYSSATFAKRPESMGIYSRTTLSHAAAKMDELVDAMTLGGAPLQQAVNAMLAQDGLYTRRERDFTGTVFDMHVNKDTSERDRDLADTYTGGLRKIVAISNTMEEATKRLNRLMKRAGKKYGATSTPRLEATNFSEKLHILVSQYLFAIKAEATAQNAIRAVKEGLKGADGVTRNHRVVITMQNTMEAGIQDLRNSGRELSFKGMLLSYLDSMRELSTGRRAFGRGNVERIYISDDPDPELARYSDRELERQLFRFETDDEGNRVGILNENVAQELFRRIISAVIRQTASEIEQMELSDMPLSPIDYIRQQLTKAGIKNVEMTGRSVGIDADGRPYDIPATAHSKKAHLRAMNEFNNGDAQVMLMNASGSTGISMHASSKFKNQDPRAMIIVQPHLDINEFMQTLWRIDRTGQVHKPHYVILQTTIPAEIRIASVLMKKMALLNANTTSNSESELKKGVDLVNQYGDEVVYSYLKSDPGFVTQLQWPKIMDKVPKARESDPDRYVLKERSDINLPEPGKLVAGVTGHMAILLASEQDAFYEKVLPDYDTLIKYLNALGQNELVAQTIDMKAETLSSRQLTGAKGSGDSVFDSPSNLERVKAEVGKKPREAEEVLEKADEVEKGARQVYLKYLADSQAWIDRNSEGRAESWPARMRDAREVISNALDLLGQTVHLQNARGLDAFGAVVDVKLDEEHLLTPSKQTFTVWANTTAQRTLRLAATQLVEDASRTPRDDFIDAYRGSEERSNERHIITGNLLAGSVAIRDIAPTAKIVQYTNYKGELRQGILLPAVFSSDSLAAKAPVDGASHMRQLLDAGRGLTNNDQSVQVTQSPSKGGYLLRIAASKAVGGKYWQDPRLNAMMSTGEFVQRASSLIGNFTADKLPQVYDRLQELGSPLYFWKTVDNEDASLGAASPAAVVKDYWEKDVVAKLANANAAFHEVLDAVVKVVSPTFGVNKDAVDQVHKLLGDRNQVNYVIDRTLHAFEKAFDKMPRPDQIAFIDRMKRGEKQPSEQLQGIADMLRKIDTDSWTAAEQEYLKAGRKESPLKWLDNHYRVLWKKIPGEPTGLKPGTAGLGRRPLSGSKGMMKQHTLEDMSEGIELGGIPVSYNPITMFKLAQADIWKLTTALKMWNWGKANGFVEFVRGAFPKPPEGMTWLDDNISRVYFPAASGEGLIEPGRYAVEDGFGRLLNNYLSRDLIRATHAGRSLLWVKNFTTSIELSLSVFHGVFETLEAVGSNIGLGLAKMANVHPQTTTVKTATGTTTTTSYKRDFLGGMMDIIKSPYSPIKGYSIGKSMRQAAGDPDAFFKTESGKNLLKSVPEARRYVSLLFTAGYKPPELEADWKNNSIRTFVDAVADLKTGTSSNYIGAGLRAFPAANEFLMKPLFDYFIPNLKVAQFCVEMAEAEKTNTRKLAGGVLTEAALARQVWRFVEDRFGELNYDTLFWNNTFKSAMQLMFRSVTWKLGSVEAFGNAFAGQAKEFINAAKEKRAPELHRNMAWLFGMFLLTAALGYILSKTLGNKEPKNLTDFVFPQIDPRDKHVRVSIPTYFKDLVHLIHSPFGYVKSSMAGWIGRVADLLVNKDYFGVQIRNTDDPATKQALQVGKYAAETLLPFSIRGYKNLSESQVSTMRKSMALLGVNPAPRYIGQTAAEQRVDEVMQGKKTEAGITPEQFEKSRSKRAMVSQMRHGKPVDIAGALSRGTLTPKDVPALYKRAQMGQLASSINYMSLPEAESVYAKATSAEKVELAGVMTRKRQNSAARSGRKMFTGF